jgi:hypothetical protein
MPGESDEDSSFRILTTTQFKAVNALGGVRLDFVDIPSV